MWSVSIELTGIQALELIAPTQQMQQFGFIKEDRDG